jgi:hypothetical protein
MLPPVVTNGPLPLLPAVCYRCKCYKKKYFIDTGMDTEFEGRLYICNDCMRDFVDADPKSYNSVQVAEIKAQAESIQASSEGALRKYEFLLNAIKRLGLDISEIVNREEKAAKNAELRRRKRDSVSTKPSADVTGTELSVVDADSRGESEFPVTIDPLGESNVAPNVIELFRGGVPSIDGLG